MSFHGGLFWVIVAIFIFSKSKKINFFKYSDIVSCVAPIGLYHRRIANFINGELYGKISNLPWAVIFPSIDNIPRHPSQIYEAILEGGILLIIIIFFAFRKNLILRTGYISGLFLMLYSIFRMFSEIFREPDYHLGYFLNYYSMGTILSFITFIFGLLIVLNVKKNEKNN